MSTQDPGSRETGAPLPESLAREVPPPDTALLAAVQGMQAVPTRLPGRSLALIAAAAAIVPVLSFLDRGLRRDLAALPALWVAAMALAWTTGLLVTLLPAVLPRKGEVLPDAARAARSALIAGIILLLLSLFATVDNPAHSGVRETWAAFGHGWWHCTSFSLTVIAPVLLVSALVLRRLFPVGGLRVAAALGAAGGAAAGLTLHFICSIGGPLHVGLVHAGAMVLGAILGMLSLPRALRA